MGDDSLEAGDTNNINNYHIGHKCIYRNIVSADISSFWCECNLIVYGSAILPVPHIATIVGLET